MGRRSSHLCNRGIVVRRCAAECTTSATAAFWRSSRQCQTERSRSPSRDSRMCFARSGFGQTEPRQALISRGRCVSWSHPMRADHRGRQAIIDDSGPVFRTSQGAEDRCRMPRLSSDNVSVSSTAGSRSIGSDLRFPELSGEKVTFRNRNVGETGNCQRKNPGRPRSDIDVLSVVPAEQGNHPSLETPAASLRIRCNSLAERGRDANGARNRRFLRVGGGSMTHHQNSTGLVQLRRTISGSSAFDERTGPVQAASSGQLRR